MVLFYFHMCTFNCIILHIGIYTHTHTEESENWRNDFLKVKEAINDYGLVIHIIEYITALMFYHFILAPLSNSRFITYFELLGYSYK